jgi:hypothetical protein
MKQVSVLNSISEDIGKSDSSRSTVNVRWNEIKITSYRFNIYRRKPKIVEICLVTSETERTYLQKEFSVTCSFDTFCTQTTQSWLYIHKEITGRLVSTVMQHNNPPSGHYNVSWSRGGEINGTCAIEVRRIQCCVLVTMQSGARTYPAGSKQDSQSTEAATGWFIPVWLRSIKIRIFLEKLNTYQLLEKVLYSWS